MGAPSFTELDVRLVGGSDAALAVGAFRLKRSLEHLGPSSKQQAPADAPGASAEIVERGSVPGAAETVVEGRFTLVLVMEVGRWLIVHDHTS